MSDRERTATRARFYDIDRLRFTPAVGDTIRIGCPDCPWRSDPVEVAPTGPNAAWIAFQSIDHLFRSHWATAHSRSPLRLVALPSRGSDESVHRPFTDDGVTYCGWDGHDGCGEVWPCSTVQARSRDSGSSSEVAE